VIINGLLNYSSFLCNEEIRKSNALRVELIDLVAVLQEIFNIYRDRIGCFTPGLKKSNFPYFRALTTEVG
jgi:hypothetical protein